MTIRHDGKNKSWQEDMTTRWREDMMIRRHDDKNKQKTETFNPILKWGGRINPPARHKAIWYIDLKICDFFKYEFNRFLQNFGWSNIVLCTLKGLFNTLVWIGLLVILPIIKLISVNLSKMICIYFLKFSPVV